MVVLIILLIVLAAGFGTFATLFFKKQKRKPIEEKKPLEVEKIQEILMQDDQGNSLTFTRPLRLEGKYQEVKAIKREKLNGTVTKSFMEVSKKVYSLADLRNVSPKGVFSAVTNPSTLSNLLSGNVTSNIIQNGGAVVNQASSFAFLSVFNPMNAVGIGIQAMAIASGQYYLHRIYEQLGKFSENTEKLLLIHDDEKAGVLMRSRKRLRQLAGRQELDEVDLQEIRHIRDECGAIFEEYRLRFEREKDSFLKEDIHGVQVKTRFKQFEDRLSSLSPELEICLEAERMEVQAEMVEIASRNKKNYADSALPELYGELKHHVENSYALKLKNEGETLLEQLKIKGETVIGSAKDFGIFAKNKEALLEKASGAIAPIRESIHNDNSDLAKMLLGKKDEEQEVVLVYDESKGKTRTFIPLQEKTEEE